VTGAEQDRHPGTQTRRISAALRPNAAFFYAGDAYDTNRPRLMGRQAAGEGFLRGFVRHGGTDRLVCYAENAGAGEEFARRAEAEGATVPVAWIPFAEPQRLAEVGCLFYPTVGIDHLAWRRRRFDQRGYSLVGITHTTATDTVMDVIVNWLIAPVQPWDAVICTSRAVHEMVQTLLEAQADYLKTRLGAQRLSLPQLPIIPLGVDCDAFREAPGVRAEWRARLGIADRDIAVLFMGRLSFHGKAHPLPMYRALQQAIARSAVPRGASLHLIQAGWFGNDEIERAFRDGAAAHCPDVVCHFLDGRDLAVRHAIWQAADIFCSLSDNLQETFGLSPIEGMAAGLPVVVSDWNGYRDTVRDGIDGFRVPTVMPPAPYGFDLSDRYAIGADDYDHYIGNTSQLVAVDTGAAAQAFAALIGDPALRRRMGAAARAEARERFDWRTVVAQTQELWADLADRRRVLEEVAPLRDRSVASKAVAHPARPDPFTAFAAYPSFQLHPESIVRLAPGASVAEGERRRRSRLAEFAAPVLPTAADLAAIIARLEESGSASAQDLVDAVRSEHPLRVFRALVWMAKMDLVRIEPAPARRS